MAQGQLHHIELARAHCERALAIREHARGPDDVSIATPLGNLAGLLADEGQYDAAVAYV
ncbi:MAG: tetratricopeptide repeat protein, partial [Kofleriaceae bacterium]